MAWHIYLLDSVETAWDNLPSVEATVNAMEDHYDSATTRSIDRQPSETLPPASALWESWKSARQAAKEQGWNDSHLTPSKVFWLPHAGAAVHGFIITQGRDGTRFVMSPMELPWLEAVRARHAEPA